MDCLLFGGPAFQKKFMSYFELKLHDLFVGSTNKFGEIMNDLKTIYEPGACCICMKILVAANPNFDERHPGRHF